jgi:hypothetical protein
MVIFGQYSVLPVTFTTIKAYPKATDIAVEWNVENESKLKQYDVEKSTDGLRFSEAGTVAAKNTSVSKYVWLDTKPVEGYNYYRVRSTDVNDKTAYSEVVKVFIAAGRPEMSVYPNPIENGIIKLQLTNQPAGEYGIRLINGMGQQLFAKQVHHAAGTTIETMSLDKYTDHGVYQLEITGPDGTVTDINVIY